MVRLPVLNVIMEQFSVSVICTFAVEKHFFTSHPIFTLPGTTPLQETQFPAFKSRKCILPDMLLTLETKAVLVT